MSRVAADQQFISTISFLSLRRKQNTNLLAPVPKLDNINYHHPCLSIQNFPNAPKLYQGFVRLSSFEIMKCLDNKVYINENQIVNIGESHEKKVSLRISCQINSLLSNLRVNCSDCSLQGESLQCLSKYLFLNALVQKELKHIYILTPKIKTL